MMDIESNAHNIIQDLKIEMSALGLDLDMPHQSMKTLQTVYTAVEYGQMITAIFKFNPTFCNPFRRIQGGFICAFIDDVCGPLTFMAAKRPCATLDLNTTFLRPFNAQDEYVSVKAELISKSKSLVVIKAQVISKDDKLIAIATSVSMILSDEQLNRNN
jgi:uncharacterized protein (TIGR00369 family)